jgi:phage tail-like protein
MRRHPDWLVTQLPVGMVQQDFFRRFVSIFQDIATTGQEDIDNLVHVPDPSVAPAPLLPWLGSWVGTPAIDSSLPELVQRDLVRTGSSSLAWRGTHRGLVPFLELVSGGPVRVTETGGIWREGEAPRMPPRVEIRVGSTGWLSDDDLLALVREEVPVNVELVLWVGERELTALPEPEPDPDPTLELEDDEIEAPPWLLYEIAREAEGPPPPPQHMAKGDDGEPDA